MADTKDWISRLREIVGEAHILQSPEKVESYEIAGKSPKAVIFPGTTEEVSKIVLQAGQNRLSVLPMGNGTKIGMGKIPERVDLLLSTRRLDRMTSVDCDNLTLSVESGITLSEVQKKLSAEGKGYLLPLDPPYTEKATLGGIVAANSSGPKRLLYGTARDIITGIKAVFPNGDLIVSGGKTVKNVSGYDMCKLLIGSFGTLGILCEMTFKLLPLPEKEASLLLPFTSLEEANAFVQEVIHSSLLPSSVELFNASTVQRSGIPISMAKEGNYLVAVGIEGVQESVERQIAEMDERAKKYGSLGSSVLNSEENVTFWKAVRDFSQYLRGSNPDLISLKSNFLISKLREISESYEKIFQNMGLEYAFISHAGNGILYSYLLAKKDSRIQDQPIIDLIGQLTSEAVKQGGNLVVESAPLSIKEKVDVWGQPEGNRRIMARLKEEIDPAGVLAPGRFVGGI